jgi:protein-S-isoprenylcysteine O-methyltransferase Ste14
MNKEISPTFSKLAFFIKLIFGVLIQIPIIFLPAWTVNWLEGWIWIGIFLTYVIVITSYLWNNNIELLQKRTSYKLPSEKWDRVIMFSLFPTVIGVFVIPGFDYQFGWSPNPTTGITWTNIVWWVELIGLVGVSIAFVIIFFVMKHNAFLARTVEIQKEDGHKVMTTGPYSVVRHPMYSAFIVLFLCAPLLLGSYWALIPGGFSGGLLIVRTVYEDKMLHEQLEGYSQYAQKTRFRIIPGIW